MGNQDRTHKEKKDSREHENDNGAGFRHKGLVFGLVWHDGPRMSNFFRGSNLSRGLGGFEYSRLNFRNAQVFQDTWFHPIEGERREVLELFSQA